MNHRFTMAYLTAIGVFSRNSFALFAMYRADLARRSVILR